MQSFSYTLIIFFALSFFSPLLPVFGFPVDSVLPTAISSRTNAFGPRFVINSDRWLSGQTKLPSAEQLKGYNVLCLAFYLTSGPWDKAQEWARLDPSERAAIKSQYAEAGISLAVSLLGSTENPTTSGIDPVALADEMANWVKEHDLDGVDVDYEDFQAMNAQDGSAEAWLIAFTLRLRFNLPYGQYIISHAPVAPWFSPGKYKSGSYIAVNQAVGSIIDWYNIQYYNQGANEYATCKSIVTESGKTWPKTSLLEIAELGVPLDKLVIGKPAAPAYATNGYMEPSQLAQCLSQAKGMGWSGGLMLWRFPDSPYSWIETARSLSWPI